ncbi:MAG: M23 family metallopeptidase [Clostridia bacterium]|nr:M23 family metallopeptidase [Clostridia bacterium]
MKGTVEALEETRKPERRKKEKDDGLFPVTVCQIIFTFIAVLSLLVLSRSGGTAAENIKEDFKTLMSVSFFKEDFSDAVKGIKNYLSSPAEISVFKLFSKEKESTEESSNEETTKPRTEKPTEPFSEEETSEKTTAPSKSEKETSPETTTAEKTTEKVTAKKTSLSLKETSASSGKTVIPASFSPKEAIVSPVSGWYSSYYGYRTNPITGNNTLHTGLDIAASQGTKIKAAYSGVVRKVGEDSRSGKYLYLTHANGSETLYCHCSKILVDEGAVIRRGETIALVGSTGWSTGPHLHFEIHKNGERLDPLPFLKNDG